ncbi:MAG: hypothetical protein MJA83_12765 [Gammaproteobacteria bacterium]|nr:hypothetical protein [Gammaproteobacteria bacterium]
MRSPPLAALLSFLFFISVSLCVKAADEDEEESSGWKHVFFGKGLAMGMEGETAARGRMEYVKVSLKRIGRQLRAKNMMHYRAQNGSWALELETVVNAFKTPADNPVDNAELRVYAFQIDTNYEIAKNIDFVLGMRRWRIDNDHTINTRVQRVRDDQRSSKDWYDPVIGVRMTRSFGKRWTGLFRYDMESPLFSSPSKSAERLRINMAYQLGEKDSIVFGYRMFKTRFNDDVVDSFNVAQIDSRGPEFGYALRF